MTRVEKRARIDLRLTDAQRATYERAAALRGQTLTQWATGHLDESASRDIERAGTIRLHPEAFDALCELLEQPMPEATQRLLASRAVWE